MQKLENYTPTRFMEKTSHYDADAADYAVMFIEAAPLIAIYFCSLTISPMYLSPYRIISGVRFTNRSL